ncbi:MAG: methyltransferase family protein [Acidobacteriota bacterium]
MLFSMAVYACWVVLFASLAFRKRPPQAREVKRGRRWGAGLAIQGLSIAVVFGLRRGSEAGLAVGIAAVALAAASVWIMRASERALGRQFAYQARLVEGHRLVTSGPYRFVRHPIYTALYGLTLATALVDSRWIAIPVFTAIYAVGTAVRVRSEERLLRTEFGAEFEQYAARVPAVVPGLRV